MDTVKFAFLHGGIKAVVDVALAEMDDSMRTNHYLRVGAVAAALAGATGARPAGARRIGHASIVSDDGWGVAIRRAGPFDEQGGVHWELRSPWFSDSQNGGG